LPTDLDFNSRILTRAGGAGAGVAMMLAQMGASPYFFSLVGADEDGRSMINEFRESGIVTSYIQPHYSINPSCVSILGSSSRQIYIDQSNLDDPILTPKIEQWLDSCGSLYVYATTPPWASSAVRAAKTVGKKIIVDIQTSYLDESIEPFIIDSEIVIFSAEYLKTEIGLKKAIMIRDKYSCDVIMSQGHRGCWLASHSEIKPTWHPQSIHVNIEPGYAIGAGDAFGAGLVFALREVDPMPWTVFLES